MQTRSKKEKATIGQKQIALRNKLWPALKEERLWLRKTKAGYTTIPRTMPLFMEIMDAMSKGKPVSTTYLDLWCRAYDECFVTLNKHREMAFHAGYSGERAEQTWANRISILIKLQFIDVKSGPSGPFSYAVIYNPYQVITNHHDRKTPGMREDLYNALLQRSIEIGADDLDS